jgi:hypothetical protein
MARRTPGWPRSPSLLANPLALLRSFALGIVFLAGVSSCSKSATAPTAGTVPTGAGSVATEVGLMNPTPDDFEVARIEYNDLLSKCMRAEGFPFYGINLQSDTGFFYQSPIENETAKRTVGYGVANALMAQFARQSQNVDRVPSLGTDQKAIDRAMSECVVDIRTRHPQITAIVEFDPSLLNQAVVAAEADPRMIQLRTKWSSCMKSRGYQFESSPAVQNDLIQRGGAILEKISASANVKRFWVEIDRLRTDERVVGRVDADCSDPIAAERDSIVLEYSGRLGQTQLDADV